VQAVRLFDKSLLIQQFTRRRIVDKTIMDYIVNIWSIIEENNLIKKMSIFSAADLSRILVPSDELSDIALIRKTVVDLELRCMFWQTVWLLLRLMLFCL